MTYGNMLLWSNGTEPKETPRGTDRWWWHPGIKGFYQIESEVFVGIEPVCDRDQTLGNKVAVDAANPALRWRWSECPECNEAVDHRHHRQDGNFVPEHLLALWL